VSVSLPDRLDAEVLDSFLHNRAVQRLVHEIVREVVRDILGGAPPPEVRRLVKLAAAAEGVGEGEVMGTSKRPAVSRARAIVAWVLRQQGRSYPAVAGMLNWSDHTSSIKAVRHVERDARLLVAAREILARVQPATAVREAEAA
jgi:chromosomal replication initiation ATPase DnaA